ncbi:DoxX family protein [Blastococcus sp. SYSU DS0533]
MASLYVLLGATAGLLVLDAMTGRSLAVSWPTALRRGLAAMFVLTGASHFVGLREDLIEMVPPALPAPDLLVTLTGVLELVGAAGLLWRPFAAWSAAGLAALLVAMFPANVYAAVSDVQIAGEPATALPLRTGMQVLYVVAAGAVWATHRRRDAAVRAGRSWHPPEEVTREAGARQEGRRAPERL